MKFGQLIEYYMKSTFLEKPYKKYGGETSPTPFSGKLKSTYFYGSITYSFIKVVFIVFKSRPIKVYWK